MDELLYRQMPHSLEAEQAVLGSMLIDANCIKDVMEKLRPEDFYLRQNREIFETIYSMFLYSKPIDGVTVAGEMERNGTYDENTTRNYLVQLMEVTPTSANVNEYADIVRDKALLRAIATVASDITGMVQDGTAEPPPCSTPPSRRSTRCAAGAAHRIWSRSAWCCRACSTISPSFPPPAVRRCRAFPRV